MHPSGSCAHSLKQNGHSTCKWDKKSNDTRNFIIANKEQESSRESVRNLLFFPFQEKLWFFYSKRAPSPTKTEVLHEKNVIFYSKKPPSLAKNSSCALIIFLFIFLLFFSFYFFFRFFFLDRKKLGFFLIENQKTEVLHEKLKIVLPMGILKKKIPTPNFTKFLNP